jgi:AraC family transcriptional regulator of adaptative response/methylated-DNA-[protein]-cysteine methyltransferase
MEIHYAVVDSLLGRLLAGATNRGISAVYLGQSDQVLESELRKEYPRATLVADNGRRGDSNHPGLRGWVEKILAHLRGQEPNLDLPTDVQATAFQRRVWEELRRIPYGTTRTYSEVARSIGRPEATRAVARACATNPTSIVVPCHRVIRADGNEAGYRWGIGRKRTLLKQETAASQSSGKGREAESGAETRRAQRDRVSLGA